MFKGANSSSFIDQNNYLPLPRLDKMFLEGCLFPYRLQKQLLTSEY